MAQILCTGLALGYEGRAILEDLSFSVHAGDYLCILGENGAGKSTLIRTLLRLQPPIRGSVSTGDGLAPNEIGYLPQQTAAQRDFPASVEEIVRSGCQGRRGPRLFYAPQERAQARSAMEQLGIAPLARRSYRTLSGGQQQRVLLARALCAARKVLLLDEPVTGLDPKATAEFYRLIARLSREEGITILMVSHDITAAVDYASHILHLGKPPFWGTTQDYLRSPVGRAFAALKGGVPQ